MKVLEENPHYAEEIRQRLEAHYAADEIIKGKYWEHGKGCAVGCTIHSGNHKDYEKMFGVPVLLARLEDNIFEGLPNDKAKEFPLQFWDAICLAKGKDISVVKWQFFHWLLNNELSNFHDHPTVGKAITAVCNGMALLADCKEWLAADAAAAAADAAAAAAADAAYAAAYAYAAADAAAAAAADAAYAAAYAAYAADAAAYAVTDAAYAATYDADVRHASYTRQSEKLIELIRSQHNT